MCTLAVVRKSNCYCYVLDYLQEYYFWIFQPYQLKTKNSSSLNIYGKCLVVLRVPYVTKTKHSGEKKIRLWLVRTNQELDDRLPAQSELFRNGLGRNAQST